MLVSEFLTNLKRRGQYQAHQTVLSDDDYVAFANDEMRSVICPKILSLRDNFFRGQKDYALTSSRRYRLPPRILGSRISAVTIINGVGGSQQYDMPQLSSTGKPGSASQGFFVSQGDIVFVGTVPTGTMRVTYPIRPPKMVSTTGSPQPTISSVLGSSVSTGAPNGTYQVIRSGSPFRTITPVMVVSSSVGTDSDSSDYERFQVGDTLISVDSTRVVPLEQELCDWLLQRTHLRVLQVLGQTDQMAAAGSKLADIEKDVMALMSPRVENAPKTIFGGQIAGWRE